MHQVASFLFVALAAYAALSDLHTRRVSNRTNLLILGSGLAAQLSVAGTPGLATGLLGVLLGLGILIVPFSKRWVGGGDVKLLAASGAWLGPVGIACAATFGLALGGAWAIALLARRPALRREVIANLGLAAVTVSAPQVERRSNSEVIPLAVPLAAACVAVLLKVGPL